MRVALIYPPSCDPTAPYLSVPTLTAWLRKHGVDVLPIDANLEAFEHMLRPSRLEELAARIERRIERLEQKPSLGHEDQLVYTQLWRARGDAAAVPGAIEGALAVLRDRTGERFYDPAAYEPAVTELSARFRLHRYPWAGALSTAHTMLWYRRHGRDAFRRLGPVPPPAIAIPGARPQVLAARFDVARIAEVSAENEAAIWEELVQERRAVGRAPYRALAAEVPPARPSPRRFQVLAGHEPEPAGKARGEGRPQRDMKGGRRPSHAGNATKP